MEVITALVDQVIIETTNLMNTIDRRQEIPHDMKKSIFITLYKKNQEQQNVNKMAQ